MKILYIDVNYKNSSTGNIVFNLHQHSIKEGFESRVCYGRGVKVNEPNVFKFGLDYETYLHALLTRITGYTGCYSYFSTKRLIRYIKRYKPDIVHIHELHAYFVNVKQLLTFLKKSNIPVVFTNHCEFIYTGKCGYSKSCTKYSNKCGNCPFLKEYPKSILFDHTSSMLKTKDKMFSNWRNIYIVNPSKWIQEKAKLSFLKDKKMKIINNGIDTNVFRFIKKDNKKNVVSVAPNIFLKIKGGYRILDIAAKMNNLNFTLVGATNEIINKPSNVKVYGLIKDKEKLAELYSNADCFLILSEFENFPTTCIEAQCCGTKVVGYDVGGVKETILEGNGTTVPYLNDEKIINEINNVINSNYDKQTVSNISRHYYSFDKMFREYLKIYKKLCH